MCSTCDKFMHNISIVETSDIQIKLKTQRMEHLQLAKKFQELLRECKKMAQRCKLTLITFDFMRNLPVPNLQTNIAFHSFYSTQLWVNIFSVHNAKNRKAIMYVYDEVFGHKGTNNVISLLFHYLKNVLYHDLVLACDNCPGQNKNRILIRFL